MYDVFPFAARFRNLFFICGTYNGRLLSVASHFKMIQINCDDSHFMSTISVFYIFLQPDWSNKGFAKDIIIILLAKYNWETNYLFNLFARKTYFKTDYYLFDTYYISWQMIIFINLKLILKCYENYISVALKQN